MNGSPPVKTITGNRGVNARRSSMSFLLCSVESWPGIASAIASARQCLHASRQAFVVSQKSRIGACSKFTGTLAHPSLGLRPKASSCPLQQLGDRRARQVGLGGEPPDAAVPREVEVGLTAADGHPHAVQAR